jgi:uncharacterized membrane protein YbaN (DUF454 family)
MREKRNRFIRIILIISGSFFVGLGFLGMFLPILPTVPFLLLAAACYVRSSERLYRWLLENRWLGNYMRNYREGKGIPLRGKILSVSLIWLTIGFSVLFIVHIDLIRILLILIALGVSIYILSIKTPKE